MSGESLWSVTVYCPQLVGPFKRAAEDGSDGHYGGELYLPGPAFDAELRAHNGWPEDARVVSERVWTGAHHTDGTTYRQRKQVEYVQSRRVHVVVECEKPADLPWGPFKLKSAKVLEDDAS